MTNTTAKIQTYSSFVELKDSSTCTWNTYFDSFYLYMSKTSAANNNLQIFCTLSCTNNATL